MKVAVTGANGFIGRHVLSALKAMEISTVAVSHDSARVPPGFPHSVAMDIADCGPDPFERMGCPDVLIHLAWNGLPNYQSNSHLDIEFPIQAKFLNACVRSGLKHMLVAGTCLEYGMQGGMLHEELPPLPITAYAKAKNALRIELESLQSSCDIELTWLRIFYLFGQGQSPTSLYSQLLSAVTAGDATFPMSPGDQVRDFMPVEAAAWSIATLCQSPSGGGIVNLCNGRPERVVDIVHRWLGVWNASLELKPGVYAYPDYEPFAFWGARAKLDSLLGESR